MKLFSLLFLISIFSFAQEVDTINLKEVALVDYSKYKQFRPRYKKVHSVTNNTNNGGIQVLSNFQLPKQDEAEIVAIEILFEGKQNNQICGESFYIKLKIVKEENPNINLIGGKWFEVVRDYKGKFIFPVNLKLKRSEVKDYLLGIENVYDTNECKDKFSYLDLIKTKEVSYHYVYSIRNDINIIKSEALNHYSLNYKIYYK